MTEFEYPAPDHPQTGAHVADAAAVATLVEQICGRVEPMDTRPRASTVLDVDTAKIVAFEFAAGQELHEHAAHHPVLIQVLRGHVEFTLPDRTVDLLPGRVLHLTPLLRHAVRAVEPTTLTVTMLLPHD